MKNKTKPNKKQTKIIPGISRTTQKTFIVTAIAAYVIQALGTVQSFYSLQGVEWTLARLFPAFVIESVIVPVVLFAFAYILFKDSPSRVSRVFKATLVPVAALMISMAVSAIFMELFKDQLGYRSGTAVWVGEWVHIVPMVISLVITVLITLYGFRSVKDKEFTASRKVQKVFIALVAGNLLVSAMTWAISMMDGSNAGFMNSSEALWNFVMSTFALFVPLGILYLIASKRQTKLTRLFNAILYILIMTFISIASFSIMYMFGFYTHTESMVAAMVMPFLAIIVFALLVTLQKIQKAF
jgi:hypothetical protein